MNSRDGEPFHVRRAALCPLAANSETTPRTTATTERTLACAAAACPAVAAACAVSTRGLSRSTRDARSAVGGSLGGDPTPNGGGGGGKGFSDEAKGRAALCPLIEPTTLKG